VIIAHYYLITNATPTQQGKREKADKVSKRKKIYIQIDARKLTNSSEVNLLGDFQKPKASGHIEAKFSNITAQPKRNSKPHNLSLNKPPPIHRRG
jgi:hypothetical protein